jgi:O-antigen ligase
MDKLLQYLRSFEPVFTVLALMHYTADWLPLIISGGASEGDGVDINSFNFVPNVLLFLMTYAVATALLLLRWKKFIHFIPRAAVIWLMILIAISSFFWSDDPARTLKSCIGLIGTTLFGIYLGSRYTFKQQLRLLAFAYIAIAILCIIFAIALPRYGLEQVVHAGAWRGIFTHKNVMGKAMTLGAIIFIISPSLFEYKDRWISRVGLGLAFFLLLMAKSSSSLINTTVLIISLFAYRTLRFRYLLFFPAFLAFITLGYVLVYVYTNHAEFLLGLIGKDPSLTGRTDIWAWVGDMIEKRPLLGYGFMAFWNGLDGASAYVIRAARWPVPYSHNGILDLWLDIGLLGVSAYFFGYFVNFFCAIVWVKGGSESDRLWPLLFLTYLMLTNASEGGMFGQNNILWVLYTSLSISIIQPIQKQPVMSPDIKT